MKWIRYRNRKKRKIDGYTVACASKQETGLPYDVYVDSLGADKRWRHWPGIPRIGVIVNDIVVPVSISDTPEILSGKEFADSKIVLEWIAHFHEALLMHWNKELDDLEILTIITSKNLRNSNL